MAANPDSVYYYQKCALAKPEPRKRTKGRKDRAEAKVTHVVRALCVLRDGGCRMAGQTIFGDIYSYALAFERTVGGDCDGPSEWAHMHAKRRSQTRGQAPELRHDTAHLLMLCRFHHVEYDAHRLKITALTRKGADGPLKFRRAAK